jgi:alpha-beta hydrolase superfamily lysophospholipase
MTSATVQSLDGTSIAYDRAGAGPAVVLVSGGLDDGAENAPLGNYLATRFNVLNYQRRGRGTSGDTQPYAVQREFEDLAAVIGAAGGRAHVYGASSGGALALEAAAAGVAGIAKIAVYEVPYNMSEDWPRRWREYVDGLRIALAEGPAGAGLELFLRLTGASDDDVAAARTSPFWNGAAALEHTLAYDAACLGTGQPDPARFARVLQPVLVLTGDAEAPTADWIVALDMAADAIVAALPAGRRAVLPGQSHVPDPAALGAELARFFGD